jgi:hypothetical protein
MIPHYRSGFLGTHLTVCIHLCTLNSVLALQSLPGAIFSLRGFSGVNHQKNQNEGLCRWFNAEPGRAVAVKGRRINNLRLLTATVGELSSSSISFVVLGR